MNIQFINLLSQIKLINNQPVIYISTLLNIPKIHVITVKNADVNQHVVPACHRSNLPFTRSQKSGKYIYKSARNQSSDILSQIHNKPIMSKRLCLISSKQIIKTIPASSMQLTGHRNYAKTLVLPLSMNIGFFYNNMLINHVQSSSKFCPKTLFMTAYYFLGPKHAQQCSDSPEKTQVTTLAKLG